MILTKDNLYIKQHKTPTDFVVCIEMPDKSRNYLHTHPMILGDCVHLIDDLLGKKIENDCYEPYFMIEGNYYRVHFTVPAALLSSSFDIDFHSRLLNLNDAVRERQMLLE